MFKDPSAKLDYAVDWSAWLGEGESIVSASWTVPVGIVEASPAPSVTGGRATVWLEGGTARERYRVSCRVETSAGRVDERSFDVEVRER